MDVTEPLLESIAKALTLKGETRASMSRAIGKSKPWMTKLFSGQVKQLPDETVKKIEDFLDIELTPVIYLEENLSPLALRVASALDSNPGLDSVFREIVALTESRKYISSELEQIGEQIIKICEIEKDPLRVAESVMDYLDGIA